MAIPIRYRILRHITEEPSSVDVLAAQVGKSKSTVRAALRRLKADGLDIHRDWYGEAREYRYTLRKGMGQ